VPAYIKQLKEKFATLIAMRSIPIVGEQSSSIAKSCDSAADMLLPLDSHKPADAQIIALGVTHS
jgi:hypothetical protein